MHESLLAALLLLAGPPEQVSHPLPLLIVLVRAGGADPDPTGDRLGAGPGAGGCGASSSLCQVAPPHQILHALLELCYLPGVHITAHHTLLGPEVHCLPFLHLPPGGPGKLLHLLLLLLVMEARAEPPAHAAVGAEQEQGDHPE